MRSLGVGSQGEHPPWAQGAGRHDYQGRHAMKTDDLIAMLSTNTEAVDRKLVIRTVWIAVVGLGLRTDLSADRALIFLITKLAFAIVIVGVAAIYLTKLTRPGGELRTPSILAAIPFVVIALLAGISLGA